LSTDLLALLKLPPGPACVAVACSGGRDSIALLHATASAAQLVPGLVVAALHVHHGLSLQADAWAEHVAAQCGVWAEQGLPVRAVVQRVHCDLAAGRSVEAVAREARYAALAQMALEQGAAAVLLAHHRRDQAETFLLQALRGAGVAGLAAMPEEVERDGVRWLRPWLGVAREAIEAYVRDRQLPFVDDDSNDDTRFARNRLRHRVWPPLGCRHFRRQSRPWLMRHAACPMRSMCWMWPWRHGCVVCAVAQAQVVLAMAMAMAVLAMAVVTVVTRAARPARSVRRSWAWRVGASLTGRTAA
jgi:tRNA(Ile)-lysidine synthetase-like protein